MSILITGGAGFIGSNLVRAMRAQGYGPLVVLDALTYAGNLGNLEGLLDGSSCVFVRGSITDRDLVRRVMAEYAVDTVLHLAAESHVDRSIASAQPFIDTNVGGTTVLLEAARDASVRRFVHISTDEVYGDVPIDAEPYSEEQPLRPSSPYAASKAASDLVVQAFVRTYGMDAIITRCTNNYGPYQFPEKFIPLMILNAIEGRTLPIYGDGRQRRDWIHVDDHCAGIIAALEHGRSGEIYHFGGACERENVELATEIVRHVGGSPSLLEYVSDRPGHDRRYALAITKAQRELRWTPQVEFREGLADTIAWYQQHSAWCAAVRDGSYRTYYEHQYQSTF